MIRYSVSGEVMARTGNRSPVHAPQGVYQAANGRWVALTVRAAGEWAQLAAAMGSPPWAVDPAFAELDHRMREHDQLDEYLAAWARRLESGEMVSLLLTAGVPCATAAVTDDFRADPQLAARRFFETFAHAVVGDDSYPGWPMRFSPGPARAHRRPAPLLGEHNEEILSGEAGLRPVDLARLADQHVIGTEPLGLRR